MDVHKYIRMAMYTSGMLQPGFAFDPQKKKSDRDEHLKTIHHLPSHLKRALSRQEVQNIEATMTAHEHAEKAMVVWKIGARTGATWGVANGIRSSYHSADPATGLQSRSQEWVILTPPGEQLFSDYGDSGSLVMTTAGHVCGLLWGGPHRSGRTFMTPIEDVLAHIKRTLGADVVEVIVREEDQVEVEFMSPQRRTGSTATFGDSADDEGVAAWEIDLAPAEDLD